MLVAISVEGLIGSSAMFKVNGSWSDSGDDITLVEADD